MAFIKTKGFVIRNIAYRDADVLLKILTSDHGFITCSVRNAKAKNSPFKMVTMPFVFAEFELFYYKNRYQLQAAELIERFPALSEDLIRLTCMSHLAELVPDILRHQAETNSVYSLWAYASYQIANTVDPVLLTHLAQLKLLADQGFAPWLGSCLICHQEISEKGETFYFSKGGIICRKSSCQSQIGTSSVMELQKSTLTILSYLLQLHHQKCFNISVPQANRPEIISFSGRYVTYIMEKEYQKLKMIRSLEKFAKGIYE